MLERNVRSMRELEDELAAWSPGSDLCYRGQSSSGWELVPSAYRAFVSIAHNAEFDPSFAAQIERDTYRSFDIEARLLEPKDILERLSVAQHHGVPTRLLDWTLNLTVAVYFSMFGGDLGDAAVWALNLSQYPFPQATGRQVRGGGFNLARITYYGRGVVASFAQPVSHSAYVGTAPETIEPNNHPDGTFLVWKPDRLDSRLVRQDGLLSWYHSFDDEDVVWNYSEHIRKVEAECGRQLLAKFIIQRDAHDDFRNDVLKRGVNEHFIWADLDGLGRRLTREHHEEMVRNAT